MARTQSYAGRKSKTTEADKKAAKARKAAKAAAAVDSSDEEAAPAREGPKWESRATTPGPTPSSFSPLGRVMC